MGIVLSTTDARINNFTPARVVVLSDSTLLSRAEYDPATHVMRLYFKSTNSVWEYRGVWPSTFGLLIAAHSVGQHFNKHIRPYISGVKIASGQGHRQVKSPATIQTQLPL